MVTATSGTADSLGTADGLSATDGLRPSRAIGGLGATDGGASQGTDAPVVISSLLVETVPSETERVIVELDKIDGVETHGTHNASVIVTIEASSINASYAIATSITAMDGVANVQLVYANFEDDPLIQKQLHG